MLPEDLKEKLIEVDSTRKKREEIASWIVRKPHYVRETLQWGYKPESELLIQSAWVLEIICKRKPHLFSKYMYLFFDQLPNINNHSALRSSAKICEILCYENYINKYRNYGKILSKEERKIMAECCFNWLITDQKVACQATAMTCLRYLGSDFKWIHPELKLILIKNMADQSAGYKARAKKILKYLS